MKTCSSCGEKKPLKSFPPRKVSKDGRRNQCRECYGIVCAEWASKNRPRINEAARTCYANDIDRRRKYAREWIREHPDVQNRNFRHRRFGISIESFNEMIEAQGGKCAICKEPETKKTKEGRVISLSIDHDHETNLIRGLICDRCNNILGRARDSVEILESAIIYLKDHARKEEPNKVVQFA